MGAIRGEASRYRCPQLPPSCIFSCCRVPVRHPRERDPLSQRERGGGGSLGEAAGPRLSVRPLRQRAVRAGGSQRAADGGKSLLKGLGGLQRWSSRRDGSRRMQTDHAGRWVEASARGSGQGQQWWSQAPSPASPRKSVSLGELQSQDRLISLPSDRRFIVFCPSWTREAGFLLEMDTAPSGDC